MTYLIASMAFVAGFIAGPMVVAFFYTASKFRWFSMVAILGLLAGDVQPVAAQYGRGCYPCRPAYVAPVAVKAVTPNYTTDNHSITYQYTINYAQTPQDQGQTVYGLSTLSQVYGATDLGTLYQQAIRLASDANGYAAQANSGATGLIAQASANQTRIAEIVAKGESVQRAFAAAAPANSATVVTDGFQAQSSASVANVAPLNTGLLESAVRKCQACHAEGTAQQLGGGAVLPAFSAMTDEQKNVMAFRLSTNDAKLRMPKNGTLTDGELKAVLSELLK